MQWIKKCIIQVIWQLRPSKRSPYNEFRSHNFLTILFSIKWVHSVAVCFSRVDIQIVLFEAVMFDCEIEMKLNSSIASSFFPMFFKFKDCKVRFSNIKIQGLQFLFFQYIHRNIRINVKESPFWYTTQFSVRTFWKGHKNLNQSPPWFDIY